MGAKAMDSALWEQIKALNQVCALCGKTKAKHGSSMFDYNCPGTTYKFRPKGKRASRKGAKCAGMTTPKPCVDELGLIDCEVEHGGDTCIHCRTKFYCSSYGECDLHGDHGP